MASVWAGRLRGPRGFERLVAIKTILPMLADDPSFVQMFLDEARIVARIQHPNVASVLDLGEQDDLLYLVLEWIDGEPLSALLREALSRQIPVPLGVAGRIVIDTCAGLHAAHELRDEQDRPLGLVHRDVSPQNVLISSDGQVKLVDFGVAKATLRATSETAPGVLKGKAGYVAPEQALSMPIDRRADLFALGILFFQMVTGRHPFRGENEVATLANLLSRNPPAPSAVASRPLPAVLDVVIQRAMARRPEDRFPDAVAMAQAVEVALRGELATPDEVATFVASLAGERLAARRRALRQAVASVERGASCGEVSSPSIQLVSADVSARWSLTPEELTRSAPSPAVHPAPPSAEVSAPAVETFPPPPGPRAARSSRWIAAGAVLLAALAAAALLRPPRAPEPHRATAHQPPEPSQNLAPSPPPSAAPSASSPLPTVSASLSVAKGSRLTPARPAAPAVAPRPLRPGGQGRWAQPVADPGF
jgi:serine/threonine-protein kinase